MDKFEKQIRNNKSKFDIKAPNKDALWNKIDAGLPVSAERKNKFGYKILFLLLCFSALGFLAGKFFSKEQNNTQQYASTYAIELLEIDRHYQKMVSYQMEQLKGNPQLDDMEKKEFMVYINQLSLEQETLKEELENNIDNQEVLEAIIKNFQQQINLIDELLDRLDRTKKMNYDTGISL